MKISCSLHSPRVEYLEGTEKITLNQHNDIYIYATTNYHVALLTNSVPGLGVDQERGHALLEVRGTEASAPAIFGIRKTCAKPGRNKFLRNKSFHHIQLSKVTILALFFLLQLPLGKEYFPNPSPFQIGFNGSRI